MSIKASQVVKLRQVTGLGMMTCKKALIEADGDMEKAIDNLRKQGQNTAIKRAGKAAKEGKVNVIIKDKVALIYEVNSETDFVARNDDFIAFFTNLGDILLENKPADIDSAMTLTAPQFDGQSVDAKLTEIMGKIGEKISFSRFKLVEIDLTKEKAFSYVHNNDKIGVVAVLSSDKPGIFESDDVRNLGKDITMQITALNPQAINREGISEKVVSKEKEIYLEQVKLSKKPEKIWDTIVTGKLNKFYKQSVLLEQEFIRDTDIKVTDRIKQTEKETDSDISVTSFVRYEVGEEG